MKKRRRVRALTTVPSHVTLRSVGSLTNIRIVTFGTLVRRVSQPAGSVSVMSANGLGHGAHADGTTNDLDHINAAMTTAGAGGTVWFPPGKYFVNASFTVYDYVNLCGAGIWTQSDSNGDGGTWIKSRYGLFWGSHQRIERMLIGDNTSYECTFRPTPRDDASAGAHTQTYGAHDNVFSFVRFKGGSDGGKQLLYIKNETDGDLWSASLMKRDSYNILWEDCEFERPQSTNATNGISQGEVVRIWMDCRAGGSVVHDLRWNRCHFGCKNGYNSGTDGYGIGRTVIFQGGPNGNDGPATAGGSEIHYDVCNDAFDWDIVDHNFYNISFTDCLFEWSNWYPLNPCDYSRPYSTWQSCQLYNYEGGVDATYGWGNDIGSQWVNVPDVMWLRGLLFNRCYVKGSSTYKSESEFCKGMTIIDSYHYPDDTGWGPHRSLYGNSVTGSFSNANRPTTVNFDRDWSGSTTTYTGSPNDPA